MRMILPGLRQAVRPAGCPCARSTTSPGEHVAPGGAVSVPPTRIEYALPVNSVSDESLWLDANLQHGWRVESQALVPHDGRLYDALHVRRVDGSVADYYFDVTSIFRGYLSPLVTGQSGASSQTRPAGNLTVEVGQDGIVATGSCQTPACTLPSATSACDLMGGDIKALPRAAFHTLGRALLISVGVYAAGERDASKLAKYSLGAALAIEAFALAWAAAHQRKA